MSDEVENPFDVPMFGEKFGAFDVILRQHAWKRRAMFGFVTEERAEARHERIIPYTLVIPVQALNIVKPFNIVHRIEDGDLFLFGDEE